MMAGRRLRKAAVPHELVRFDLRGCISVPIIDPFRMASVDD